MSNYFKSTVPGWLIVLAGCVFAGLSGVVPAKAAVNVTQHHNHLSRDGLYIDPAFTKTLAAGLTRDLTFNGTIAGNVYAQPLYIEGGPRGRAVIIAVTESNNVYALDAITGLVVWHTNVAPPAPSTAFNCGNISPSGILGTPVVDLPSRALFFNAATTNGSGTVENRIYSLNVDTGSVNPGWPVVVSASLVFGGSTFDPRTQGEQGRVGGHRHQSLCALRRPFR